MFPTSSLYSHRHSEFSLGSNSELGTLLECMLGIGRSSLQLAFMIRWESAPGSVGGSQGLPQEGPKTPLESTAFG